MHPKSSIQLFLILAVFGIVPFAAAEPPLEKLHFLLGEWEGSGAGDPGQGTGHFSFLPDLRGNVIIRRNHASYPESAGRPAATHDDLMVIYYEENTKSLRASYFDSEGHVIQYGISPSDDGKTATFLSDARASQPRYRLSYMLTAEGLVAGKFEVASPGQPDTFVKYLEWTGRCKQALPSAVATETPTRDGIWIPIAGELAGRKFPDEVFNSMELTLKGDTYFLRSNEAPDRGVLRVDTTAEPMTMDITGTEGPNKGRTILAIFEQKGDTMTVCYDLSGSSRPADFKTTPQSRLFLVTYRRRTPSENR